MLIDCDRCTMRGVGCGDCVVSLLLGAPEDSRDVDEIEAAAFGALAAGGLAPPLRLVPVSRTNRPDVSWWPSGPVAVDLPTPDDLGPDLDDLDLDLGGWTGSARSTWSRWRPGVVLDHSHEQVRAVARPLVHVLSGVRRRPGSSRVPSGPLWRFAKHADTA